MQGAGQQKQQSWLAGCTLLTLPGTTASNHRLGDTDADPPDGNTVSTTRDCQMGHFTSMLGAVGPTALCSWLLVKPHATTPHLQGQLLPVPWGPFAQQHCCQLPDLWVCCCLQLLHELRQDLWRVGQLLHCILCLFANLLCRRYVQQTKTKTAGQSNERW
jgi:hypothetical protein